MSFTSIRSARCSTAVKRASIPASSSLAIAGHLADEVGQSHLAMGVRGKTNAVRPDNHVAVTLTSM